MSKDDEISVSDSTKSDIGCTNQICSKAWWIECKQICLLAIPIIFTGLIEYMVAPISLIFCGRLGETELAAAGLSISIFHVGGMSINLGLLTASDTLFSQTYGSKNKKHLGIQVQRSCCILFFCLMPCWAIHVSIHPILLATGMDPVISRMTSKYVQTLMPGLMFISFFQILTKYVQIQNKVFPPLFAGIFGNICNAIAHYLLINHTDIGFIGSAVAQVIAFFCQAGFLFVYILVTKLYKKTWNGIHRELWDDWGIWFRLAVPGMIMLGMEWWVCESGNLVAVFLGTQALAAQSILNTVESIMYCLIPQGLGMASAIRVGQYLGAGKHREPKRTTIVSITLGLVCGLFTVTLLALLRFEIPKIFSIDEGVIQLTGSSFPAMILFQFTDGIVGVTSGLIRGIGLQKTGAIVSCVCMYIVGAPTGLCLMLLTKMGISGFWIGIFIGSGIESIIYIFILTRINWRLQMDKASKRIAIKILTKKQEVEIENTMPEQTDFGFKEPSFTDSGTENDIENSKNLRIAIKNENDKIKTCPPCLIIKRTLFITCTFTPLIVSVVCYFLIDLSNYFPSFCQLENRTLIQIPNLNERQKYPDLYTWINSSCKFILP